MGQAHEVDVVGADAIDSRGADVFPRLVAASRAKASRSIDEIENTVNTHKVRVDILAVLVVVTGRAKSLPARGLRALAPWDGFGRVVRLIRVLYLGLGGRGFLVAWTRACVVAGIDVLDRVPATAAHESHERAH
jgi:hypothetical protein